MEVSGMIEVTFQYTAYQLAMVNYINERFDG